MSAIADALLAIAREAWPRAAYCAPYRYRVIDHVASRVRLQAVRAGAGLPDLLYISVLPGVAGAEATLRAGSLVLVQFIEADPAQPVVTHFEAAGGDGWLPIALVIDASDSITIGASTTTISLGAAPRLGVARVGDAVQAGPFAGTITSASAQVEAGS